MPWKCCVCNIQPAVQPPKVGPGPTCTATTGCVSAGIWACAWDDPAPPPAVLPGQYGDVHTDAWNEVSTGTQDMATSLRQVFSGTAGGRSSPGTSGLRHIRVGAYNVNMVFDPETSTVLGVVYEHFEGAMSSAQKRVFDRKGGTTIRSRLHDTTLHRE